MAQSKQGGLLVGVIFLLVGLGIFAGGLWSYFSTKSFVARAVAVPGVVVANDAGRDSDGDTIYNPVFEFSDQQGAKHRVRSNTGSNPASFNVGERVEVLYEPNLPDDAEINSFGQLWFLPTFLIPFGLVFASIGAAVSGIIGLAQRRAQSSAVAPTELTPHRPSETTATEPSPPPAVDPDNPYAKTDGPVRKNSDRGSSHFGSGAKYN